MRGRLLLPLDLLRLFFRFESSGLTVEASLGQVLWQGRVVDSTKQLGRWTSLLTWKVVPLVRRLTAAPLVPRERSWAGCPYGNVEVGCPSWVTCPGADLADGWKTVLPPSFHRRGEVNGWTTCHGDEGSTHLLGGGQADQPGWSWGRLVPAGASL